MNERKSSRIAMEDNFDGKGMVDRLRVRWEEMLKRDFRKIFDVRKWRYRNEW